MSTNLQLSRQSAAADLSPRRLPPIPWRDPHSVEPAELAAYIEQLEQACLDHPRSADLRTLLGMAYAMNYEVYKSADALEAAIGLEPDNFFAQLKYSELWYRLRALHRAETETKKALELAGNHLELAMARHQLSEIRRLKREGTIKPEWKGSLRTPALMFAVMAAILCLSTLWR